MDAWSNEKVSHSQTNLKSLLMSGGVYDYCIMIYPNIFYVGWRRIGIYYNLPSKTDCIPHARKVVSSRSYIHL